MAAASEATTTNRYLPHSGQRIITASSAMRIGKLIALYLNTLDSFRYFPSYFRHLPAAEPALPFSIGSDRLGKLLFSEIGPEGVGYINF